MENLALLLRFLPLLPAAGQPDARDPTLGIELPPRVTESRDFQRWKALVSFEEDEPGTLVPALGERRVRQALAIAKEIDPQGALHALTHIHLGSLWSHSFQLQEKHEEVRSHFTKAVGIFERQHGREHVGVALGLHRLGSMLAMLANMTLEEDDLAAKHRREAVHFLLEALEIRKKKLGKVHRDLLECHTELGSLYDFLDDYSAAEKQLRLAIEQARGLPEIPGVNLAELHESLAESEVELRKWKEAEQSFLELLRLTQQSKPPAFGDLARTHEKVADFYVERRRYAEAEPQYRAAMVAGPKEDPAEGYLMPWQAPWRGLARALQGQRKYDESLAAWSRALKLEEASEDPGWGALGILMDIVRAEREAGRLDGARASLDRAWKLCDALAGEEQGEVSENAVSHWRARTLLERARTHLAAGKRDEASASLQQSLEHFARSGCSSECYYQGQVWREIGDLQTSRGKHAEAEAALRRALEGLEDPDENIGRDLEHDEILASALRELAAICRKLGKEDEARTLLDRVRAREAGEVPAGRPGEKS